MPIVALIGLLPLRDQRWAMLPQIAALTPRAMVREVDLRAEPGVAELLLRELRLRMCLWC